MKKLIILLGVLTVSLTSCLKDKPNVDLSNIAAFAELVHSGKAYFNSDAVTADPDANGKIALTFQVNITGQYAPTKDVNVVLAVDNTVVTAYNASDKTNVYLPMAADAFSLPVTTATIKAGTRLATFSVIFDKTKLDPSKSYMLPIVLKSASGVSLSSNFSVKYYHFIGNDFAGAYAWNYRRWQNGTGVGVPDFNLNYAGTILPVSATEFQMETGYNGNHVKYNVTFTRTVDGSGTVLYTNWDVKFNAANLAIWADAGITNMVAPKFTIPPPANGASAKKFEINYVSGGASGRYIDDTYSK